MKKVLPYIVIIFLVLPVFFSSSVKGVEDNMEPSSNQASQDQIDSNDMSTEVHDSDEMVSPTPMELPDHDSDDENNSMMGDEQMDESEDANMQEAGQDTDSDEVMEVEDQMNDGEDGDANKMGTNGKKEAAQMDNEDRSDTAREHMSEVAVKVEMLQKTFMGGDENGQGQGSEENDNGIGKQVRLVANAQSASQTKVEKKLEQAEKRSGIVKFFVGPDKEALDQLNEEISMNMVRIKQFQKLLFQTDNKGEQEAIRSTIIAILDQNTSLQARIAEEENSFSLVGWLRGIFS